MDIESGSFSALVFVLGSLLIDFLKWTYKWKFNWRDWIQKKKKEKEKTAIKGFSVKGRLYKMQDRDYMKCLQYILGAIIRFQTMRWRVWINILLFLKIWHTDWFNQFCKVYYWKKKEKLESCSWMHLLIFIMTLINFALNPLMWSYCEILERYHCLFNI